MLARTLASALLVTAVLCGPAFAQLALPGATAPAPVGTVVAPRATAKPKPRVVVAPVAPPIDSLAGKTLHLNGGGSEMSFAARDKTADLSRLLLTGTKISNGRDACQVNVAGMPLPLADGVKSNGLFRYALPVPACPVSIDVVAGAVEVPSDTPACTFKEADCTVDMAGLWGPAPGEIGPDEVKTIERERTEAERKVRAAYQGLTKATKDKSEVRGFASEQAGFSSRREELCRDYIGETRHGYCASRVTAARAAALETQLAVAEAQKELRKSHKK